MRTFLIFGLILLLIPTFLASRKVFLEWRYDTIEIQNNSYTLNGHTVKILDNFNSDGSAETTMTPSIRRGTVSIFIDSKDYSLPTEVSIHLRNKKMERYPTWVALNLFIDKLKKQKFIVLVQRIDSFQPNYDIGNVRFRILYVDLNGNVKIDVFKLSEAKYDNAKLRFIRYVQPAEFKGSRLLKSSAEVFWYHFRPLFLTISWCLGFVITLVASMYFISNKRLRNTKGS